MTDKTDGFTFNNVVNMKDFVKGREGSDSAGGEIDKKTISVTPFADELSIPKEVQYNISVGDLLFVGDKVFSVRLKAFTADGLAFSFADVTAEVNKIINVVYKEGDKNEK